MSPLLEDAWFVALLDHTIAKHGRQFTPRQVRAFREKMAFTFETHPIARRILVRARPDLRLSPTILRVAHSKETT